MLKRTVFEQISNKFWNNCNEKYEKLLINQELQSKKSNNKIIFYMILRDRYSENKLIKKISE